MHRTLLESLAVWKANPRRKPLILEGARQVGKTWLAHEFGRRCFERTAYVTFQDNAGLQSVFEGSLSPRRLLDAVSAESGVAAGDPETLVVFDEVQDCPRALTSLKMFCEQAPEVPVVAAGSLLGVAMHRGVSFPVGKVEHMTVNPLTLVEFLMATGDGVLANFIEARDFDMMGAFSERFADALRRYCFVGGMPEAVAAYADTGDYRAARAVQDRLLYDYDHDFSKYAGGEEAERIRMVWRSLPSQLARENKKFVYSAVRPGARARSFEGAINWLVDAGLAVKVPRVSKPGLPLAAYEDVGAFKLYMLDVGLLGAASRLDSSTVFNGDALFSEFKGALTEQYVCQQLAATGEVVPFYWSAENSSGEIDFLYDHAGKVFPVEVKAERNVRARSLRAFTAKYGGLCAVRLSLEGYREQGWMTNVPLCAAGILPSLDIPVSEMP